MGQGGTCAVARSTFSYRHHRRRTRRRKKGRPPKEQTRGAPEQWTLRDAFRFWLYATFLGWSVNKAYARLSAEPQWAGRVPSPSTVSRRRKRPSFERYIQRFFRRLCRHAVRTRVSDLHTLVIDSTAIEAPHDPHARWGYTSDGPFRGYKLHFLVNRRGVPLAAWVSQGHRSDHDGVRPLLDAARHVLCTDDLRGRVRFVVADAGYDAEDHYVTCTETVGARFLAPDNPRNRKQREPTEGPRRDAFRFLRTLRGRIRMAKRSEIERVFSQMTDPGGINCEQIPRYVRGKVKVRQFLWAKAIQFTAGILDNRLAGRSTRTMVYAA